MPSSPRPGRRLTCLPFLRASALAALALTQLASAAPADPLLEPPLVNSHPGPEYQDDVRAGAMIIGMDRTPRGRIWGCWTGTGDNAESYFILATSDDNGATWSKPRLVIDPADPIGLPPRYALIGNLWTDPTGRLWLFFDQHMRGSTTTNWYLTCENPDAAEPVWSQPTHFADGSTLNKPTVLRNGDWLLPVSLLTPGRRATVSPPDPASQPGAHVFASTDRGRTWRRRGGTALPAEDVNHNEHMLVELRDGRLWMLLRTRYGIAEAHSPDGGRSWTVPRPSPIQNPSTRFFLRRLASGRLLLVKNGPIGERYPARSHLTAFLSDDDGATWGRGLLLDDRRSLSYPDGFQAPDGRIHILYDWNRHTNAEILLASFREEDVLTGQPVSRDTRLRHVVDKARAPQLATSTTPDRTWNAQTAADAKLDTLAVPFAGGADGGPRAAEALLRELADGSWFLAVSASSNHEPADAPAVLATRSADHGRTWSPAAPLAPPSPGGPGARLAGAVELLRGKAHPTLVFSTHGRSFTEAWRTWSLRGDPFAAQWSAATPLPGRHGARTFVRNAINTRDGDLLVPFQHYDERDRAFADPRCGVLRSRDGGRTWTEHGDMRLAPVQRSFAWTESHLLELAGDRLLLLVRQAGLMGLIYVAESRDGGRTWPEFAQLRRAPHAGTGSFFSLGGDGVALVHNPGNRLALWVSFDGLRTWPYQRLLSRAPSGGPKDNISHPHGFVSADCEWLHFAYVDDTRRVVQYNAKLPSRR